MPDLIRELTVGAAGSVIGAAIVYFASTAAALGKSAKAEAVQRRRLEEELWRTRKIQVRMEITNYYLFEVLRSFLLGTILTVIPSIASFAAAGYGGFEVLFFLFAALTGLGLVFYFIGLGRVVRYLAIRRSD